MRFDAEPVSPPAAPVAAPPETKRGAGLKLALAGFAAMIVLGGVGLAVVLIPMLGRTPPATSAAVRAPAPEPARSPPLPRLRRSWPRFVRRQRR
jgi:hypothetical protein